VYGANDAKELHGSNVSRQPNTNTEETRKIIKSFSPRPEFSPSTVYVPSAITTVAM